MKKLFLASSGLSAIVDFVGGDPDNMSMLFITTAGNLDDDPWWIEKDREVLTAMGFSLYELDIETADRADMNEQLMTSDIVYVTGGNSFYLLKQLRKTGFDKMLTDYVNNGGLYAGASAGAIVAGADIALTAPMDKPDMVYGLKSTAGLKFVPIVLVPHSDNRSLADTVSAMKADYDGDVDLVLLDNDHAIIVDDNTWATVESKRSPEELEWLQSDDD